MDRRTDWSAEWALGAAFLALLVFSTMRMPSQLDVARLSGAVIPDETFTHSFQFDRRVDILSSLGDRRVLLGKKERATALRVVVVLPPVPATTLYQGWRTASSPVQQSFGSTYRLDGGANRGAVVDVVATYDFYRRTATLYGTEYRLSRGDLFVVGFTEEMRPVVTQVDAALLGEHHEFRSSGDLLDLQRELLRAARSGTWGDPEVQRGLNAILDRIDPAARRQRDCGRAKAAGART